MSPALTVSTTLILRLEELSHRSADALQNGILKATTTSQFNSETLAGMMTLTIAICDADNE